jgi:TonB family protein
MTSVPEEERTRSGPTGELLVSHTTQSRRLALKVRGTSAVVAAVTLTIGCAGDQEMELPAPLYGEIPIQYPLELWDQDVEGMTLLKVRVTDVGGVDSVVVLESSGHGAFDSAAIAGARQLRFNPARKNGRRIDVWAQVPVHFSKRPRPPE